MTQRNNFTAQPLDVVSIGKWMLLGGGIALILIAVFLFQVRDPNPEWGKLWMVKPLIVVPLAGAMGGLFYYFINYRGYQSSWKKMLAILLGLIVYIIGLWLGTVLGLNGTLWN